MMTIFGCDASDYDWGRGSFNVASMRSDGIQWLTHKATEGTSTKHVHLADALNRGRAAGVPILGAYHVVRSSPGVAAQVAYFFAYLDSAVPWWRTWPGFLLQVDLEKWPYDPVTHAVTHPLEGAELQRATGTGTNFTAALMAAAPPTAFVICYASKGQYGNNLTGIPAPLWNANYPSGRAAGYRDLYPGDSGPGWVTYSGKQPLFWQYASSATIGSQPGCDVNAYRGTLAQLQAIISPPPTGDIDVALTDEILVGTGSTGHPGNRNALEGLADIYRHITGSAGTFWAQSPFAVLMADTVAIRAGQAAAAAAITALAGVISAGGGSVDVATILAAIDTAATTATNTALAAFNAEAKREADLQARLGETLAQ